VDAGKLDVFLTTSIYFEFVGNRYTLLGFKAEVFLFGLIT